MESQVQGQFLRDIAQHQMTIELDQGVHRCLHLHDITPDTTRR
jgi:hypothetical protein